MCRKLKLAMKCSGGSALKQTRISLLAFSSSVMVLAKPRPCRAPPNGLTRSLKLIFTV
jgi:hypothetical protein